MNNFSISRCIGGAWDLTTKHWKMCIYALVMGIVITIISNTSMPNVAEPNSNMTLEDFKEFYLDFLKNINSTGIIIAEILQYVFYAGLYKMALNGYNGLSVDASAYKLPATTYVKLICAGIVGQILIAVGFFLFIIPSIIVAVRFLFVPYILLDEPQTDFIGAFKKSWEISRGHFWQLFGLGVLMTLIHLVGIACFYVGICFTMVLSLFALAIAYYHFKDTVVA